MILLLFVSSFAICSGQFADEMQSYEAECLVEGAFTCLGGGCVAQEKYCDGNPDCNDGSDENFCMNHRPDQQYCNETHQHLCADGRQCLPDEWVCNGEVDCSDGSDESNCPTSVVPVNSTCKGFTCDGKKCISMFWVCDGRYDCDDKSDEDVKNTCRRALLPKTLRDMYLHDVSFCESRARYTCLDQSYCLPLEHVCDGVNDCRDGSDEGTFCERWDTMCKNFTCPQNAHCRPQRSGATCVCETYKKYNSTSKQCEESNHCMEEKPVCSHMCVDKADHFECVCDHGYTPDLANYLCFAPDPEALLFFNTRNDIQYVKVKSKHQVVVTTGIKEAHGVSYDGNHLYWVETAKGHQAIMRARLDDVKESKQVLAALGLEDPGDIAIDYLGDNIYFSDAVRGIISACRADGSLCTTLRATTKHPRFVTLDPKQGKMYWADFWSDKPVIAHAKMDGSQTEALVNDLNTFATGLALDAPNGRLYYVDGTIKVVRLEDKIVYSFLEEPFHHPYSLAVFENTVFWSDWTSNTIQTTDKIHGTTINRNILLRLDVPVFDMHIYHPVLMNKTQSPCSQHDCAICLITSNTSHVCACPDDMKMMEDHCQHIPGYRPQYLIVGAGSTFSRVHYNSIGNPETHGTHLDIGRVQAMAYDSTRDALYIYDSQRKSVNHINMSDFTLGVTELLLYKGLENVVDMDYDFVSDTLYILDAGRRQIEVVSLRNKHNALVYSFADQEIPISFCVMSEYGRMLVAVLESEEHNKIHIDSIGLDGTHREHLLMHNVVGPNVRLRYSPEMNVVYIADEGNGVIHLIHPEGTGMEIFRKVSKTVANLAVTDTHVFWTKRRSSKLYWADVHEASHKIRRIELSIFPNQTHLHILTTSLPPDAKNRFRQHKCSQPTTPCSHICLQSPHSPDATNVSTMGYTCRCPPGYLTFDRCLKFVECTSNEFHCHKSEQCFPATKKCDGVKDCTYGEDEERCVDSITQRPEGCPLYQTNCHGKCIPKTEACKENTTKSTTSSTTAPPLTCATEEFRCADNSICIERTLACDGHADCTDSSDEHPDACNVRSCFDTEFMCVMGSCIPISWRCDRNEDCVDGSDEVDCDDKACPEGSFQCGNGSCVEVYKRCDGKFDCLDQVDEEDCDNDTSEFIEVSEQTLSCSPWEHPCERNKTICVPLTARCNGKVDCPGGTDEDGCDFHCGGLAGGMFPCKQEYKCVRKTHVCNGRKDCSDGSDETIEACMKVNKTVPLHSVQVSENCSSGYRCDSGQCVEWALVCNRRTDCFDGSDEGGLCGQSCIWGTCQQDCHASPRGRYCACSYGYVPQDGTCRDVDECQQRPCSHACHNLPGSFVCSCHKGYALRSDRRSCKALHGRLSIIYTKGNSIWSTSNHLHNMLYQNTEGIFTGLDVDVRNKKVYVTSSQARKLFEVNLSGKEPSVDEIANVGIPSKVALDWITGNVYFVDDSTIDNYIRVCNFYKKRCAKLQQLSSGAKVTALTVDPANHLMFYCISGAEEALVHSASLSGRNETVLGSLSSCSGLAVDSFSKILYVASEEPSSIVQVDYSGTVPYTVILFGNNPNVHSPRGIALFEDHIYFLSNSHINRCLLFTSKSCHNYGHAHNASSFVIRHESVQRDDILNDCKQFVCSNICVLEQNGPVCICHDGTPSNDGACAVVKTSELALFNGWSYQEYKGHSVSFVLVTIVLLLFAVYILIFVYYHFIKKRKPTDYMQVRYKNAPEGQMEQTPNPLVEMPDIGYAISGTAHEFVNPLQFLRNHWQESFYKKKPVGTANLMFETQHNLSDTESDLDVKESRTLIGI